MKNLVSGYPKTVVSHCRGCIFQGFQFLQKSGKTTSEIDSKWPPNPLKSGSEGSPKRSLKLQWKIQKIIKKISFLDLLLGTFFHQVLFVFPCIFKLRFWEPSEPLFNGFWGHFGTTSGVVFPTFWRRWKPWKMQPLQRETTVFEYPVAGFFIIFPHIFQDKF